MHIGNVRQIEDQKVATSLGGAIQLDMVVVVDTLVALKQLADLQDACIAVYAAQGQNCLGGRKFVRINGEEAASRMDADASLATHTAFVERSTRTVHATSELMRDLKRQKQLEQYTFHVIDEDEAKELLEVAVAKVLIQQIEREEEKAAPKMPTGEVLPRMSDGERALLYRGYGPMLSRVAAMRICYGLLQSLQTRFIEQMRHIEEVRRENAIRAYLDAVQKEQRDLASARLNLGGGLSLRVAGLVAAQQ